MKNDFIYRVGSPSNILGRPPCFYRSNELTAKGCRFASVYAVKQEDAYSIQYTAGTVEGFKGTVWSERLWVDCDDTEGALEAKKTLDKEGYDYVAYETGNRGMHFGIAREAKPSHTLPMQDKQWVRENLKGADLSLYWHLHLIRLPGTLHEKTGKPKRLVERKEGKVLLLSQYNAETSERPTSELPLVQDNRDSIFKLWSVVSNLTEGQESRHKQLVKLSASLHTEGKVTIEEAMWVVGEVNRGFKEPKPQEEIEKIVQWAYNK